MNEQETIENAQETVNHEQNIESISDESFANALKELSPQNQNDDAQDTNTDETTNDDKSDAEALEREELLKDDKDLYKYDTFIKAGLSKEEALEKVYGEFKNTYQQKPDTQFQKMPEISTSMGNVTAQDYEMLVRAYQNPTDSNLLFHLKKDPELRADFGLNGIDIDKIQTLDLYQDPMANNILRKIIKESYRNKIGSILNEIDETNRVIEQNNKVRANLVTEFEADFLKDFPELNSDDIKTYSLAKHFIDRFKQKCSVLSEAQQNDSEIIRKLYNSAKAEYKKIYPALKKKLGFEDEPKKIENAQITKKKLNEMQENGSIPTNLGTDETSFNLSSNSSDDDFAKAFKALVSKK